MNKYDRFRIPARIRRGGFGHEKIYRVRTASGKDFQHIGFSHYMWDAGKKILPDTDFEGEIDGYVMVYFRELKDGHTAIVEPPQCHGVDHSGCIEVAKNDLEEFPREDIKY